MCCVHRAPDKRPGWHRACLLRGHEQMLQHSNVLPFSRCPEAQLLVALGITHAAPPRMHRVCGSASLLPEPYLLRLAAPPGMHRLLAVNWLMGSVVVICPPLGVLRPMRRDALTGMAWCLICFCYFLHKRSYHISESTCNQVTKACPSMVVRLHHWLNSANHRSNLCRDALVNRTSWMSTVHVIS